MIDCFILASNDNFKINIMFSLVLTLLDKVKAI